MIRASNLDRRPYQSDGVLADCSVTAEAENKLFDEIHDNLHGKVTVLYVTHRWRNVTNRAGECSCPTILLY